MKSKRADIKRGAWVDGEFRYQLSRSWGGAGLRDPYVLYIMLNPSDADSYDDDSTMLFVMGQAEAQGYSRVHVVNLYAYRSPKPKVLKSKGYPVGKHNDAVIQGELHHADRVVVAWGPNARLPRARAVMAMVRAAGHTPMALRVTQYGAPGHPLYIPYETQPEPYSDADVTRKTYAR